MVDGAGCDHEARVEGTAGDAAKGMPCSWGDDALVMVSLIDADGILTIIEPIPEVGKAVLDKVLGGPEVEPRVDCSMAGQHMLVPRVLQALASNNWTCLDPHTLVNDTLEADDGEQSARNGGGGNGAQDDQTQQATGVAARLSLEEEVGTAGGRDVGGHGGGGGGEEGGLAGGGWWHWKVQQCTALAWWWWRAASWTVNTTPLAERAVASSSLDVRTFAERAEQRSLGGRARKCSSWVADPTCCCRDTSHTNTNTLHSIRHISLPHADNAVLYLTGDCITLLHRAF